MIRSGNRSIGLGFARGGTAARMLCLAAVGLFGALPALAAPTTVYLVRHAEKDAIPQHDPQLSRKGMGRAFDLQRVLRSVTLSGVFHTEARRTQQTVTPVAKGHDLRAELVGAPEPDKLIEKIKTEHTGKAVVVAGHSNTIPDLLKRLGVPEDQIPTIGEHEYDHMFVVTLTEDGKTYMMHMHYGEQTSQ